MILGALVGTVMYSCAMGGKPVKFKEFPNRNAVNSVWMICADGDNKNVCKNVCDKYKKNECKKRHIERLNISDALNEGYVFMSRQMFLDLLQAGL